jgi:probable phosphoglycerate mutase
MAAPAPQLWLLRHGATSWARAGRHTGRTDLPLLPEGEEEARGLKPLLTRQPFRAVLTSPLQRARRTCELAGLGERAELCEDLREWDYGDYEGITTADIRLSVPDWSVWSHPCPNGERLEDIAQRCQRVLNLALERAGDDGWVALVAWRAPGWAWGRRVVRCWCSTPPAFPCWAWSGNSGCCCAGTRWAEALPGARSIWLRSRVWNPSRGSDDLSSALFAFPG